MKKGNILRVFSVFNQLMKSWYGGIDNVLTIFYLVDSSQFIDIEESQSYSASLILLFEIYII